MNSNRNCYVYVYSDPETRKPFYVGEGTRERVWDHLQFKNPHNEKQKKIKSILDKGMRPIVEIVQCGLSKKEAHKVEAAFIQFFGIDNLTNARCGMNYTSKIHADFIDYLTHNGTLRLKREGKPVLLLDAHYVYYAGMSRFQLYDAIRGNLRLREEDRDWIGHDKRCLVLAVLDGIVIDVYVHPHCEEMSQDMREQGYEPVGDAINIVAGEPSANMRNKYVGKKVNVNFGSLGYRTAYV